MLNKPLRTMHTFRVPAPTLNREEPHSTVYGWLCPARDSQFICQFVSSLRAQTPPKVAKEDKDCWKRTASQYAAGDCSWINTYSVIQLNKVLPLRISEVFALCGCVCDCWYLRLQHHMSCTALLCASQTCELLTRYICNRS